MKRGAARRIALAVLSACVAGELCLAQAAQDAPRAPAATLARAGTTKIPDVDARGFIHRWLVLEPVPVEGRLTEPAVQEAIAAAALPEGSQPAHGATVTIKGAPRAWHALDTTNYNLNLYHFAWALSRPTSNVLFWVETTIEAPEELQNVRLAIGSNAASRWWLNGVPVIALNDDRQSVIDDGVSKRLSLRKGRNVIRAAIVNGGGATDFCARFLDENDLPIQRLKVISP